MKPRKNSRDDAPLEGEVMPQVAPGEGEELVPVAEDEKPKMTVVEWSAREILRNHTIIRFRGRNMLLRYDPYPHFRRMTDDDFNLISYPILGGVTRGRINDVRGYVPSIVPDHSNDDHLILFGLEDPTDGSYADSGYYHAEARSMVWNSQTLEWTTVEEDPELAKRCVWRSPYGVIQNDDPVPFVLSLAGGDRAIYDDIMQSMAALLMDKKPDGVIWWVGDGANGKSTLMDALYKIFPGQLASLTVATLTTKTDASRLNGTLANVVKESSEGRVEDTEIYKAIGTHEDFSVHRFYSQEMEMVRGNMHHIFSANNIPTFNDKGFSARRRTFIIPFRETFQSDPTFEARTFTPEMFGHLIYQISKYAQQLRRQQYRYKWSQITDDAKGAYDADANNAEVFATQLLKGGVVAFDSFNAVRIDYENWCADEGFVPLGVTNMRRAVLAKGFDRVSARVDGATIPRKIYMIPTAKVTDLQKLSLGRPGLYTMPGFTEQTNEDAEPKVPDFEQPTEPEDTETTTTTTTEYKLKGEW